MALAPKGKILVILPNKNSVKKDYDFVFSPAANAIGKEYANSVLVRIDVPAVDSTTLTVKPGAKQKQFEAAAEQVVAAIRMNRPSHLVILCHGWDAGLQVGFRLRKQRGQDKINLENLIDACRQIDLNSICLFACSAGDEPGSEKTSPGTGDNSFADYLRDRLDVTVIGHWTTGHATRNPDLIVFESGHALQLGGTPILRQLPGGKGQSPLYKNATRLLCEKIGGKPNKSANLPPFNDIRPVWLSLPLVSSYKDLVELLSQMPRD